MALRCNEREQAAGAFVSEVLRLYTCIWLKSIDTAAHPYYQAVTSKLA